MFSSINKNVTVCEDVPAAKFNMEGFINDYFYIFPGRLFIFLFFYIFIDLLYFIYCILFFLFSFFPFFFLIYDFVVFFLFFFFNFFLCFFLAGVGGWGGGLDLANNILLSLYQFYFLLLLRLLLFVFLK